MFFQNHLKYKKKSQKKSFWAKITVSFGVLFFLAIVGISVPPQKTYANQSCVALTGGRTITVSGLENLFSGIEMQREVTIVGLNPGSRVEVCITGSDDGCYRPDGPNVYGQMVPANGVITAVFGHHSWTSSGTHRVRLEFLQDLTGQSNDGSSQCTAHEFTVNSRDRAVFCVQTDLMVVNRPGNNRCIEDGDQIVWSARLYDISTDPPQPYANRPMDLIDFNNNVYPRTTDANGNVSITFTLNRDPITTRANPGDTRTVDVQFLNNSGRLGNHEECRRTITISAPNQCSNEISQEDLNDENQKYEICNQVPGKLSTGQGYPGSQYEACVECFGSDGEGIWTAIGCISTDGDGTIRHLVVVALGMAGGIGLLMIIAAGAMFTMSRNDPKKVGDAKDLITSVLIGLLFIVFSVTILQFIGVGILGIPEFGN